MRTKKHSSSRRQGDPPAVQKSLIEQLLKMTPTQLGEWGSQNPRLPFDKVDLNHWSELLDYMDEILEAASPFCALSEEEEKNQLQKRAKKLSDARAAEESDKIALKVPEFTDFPCDIVVGCLKLTCSLFENCSGKSIYASVEHIITLLASEDLRVVTLCLETLHMLVKKSQSHPNRTTGAHNNIALHKRLFSICQGWGGREDGLGLANCCQRPDSLSSKLLDQMRSTTLTFKALREPDAQEAQKRTNAEKSTPLTTSFVFAVQEEASAVGFEYSVTVQHDLAVLPVNLLSTVRTLQKTYLASEEHLFDSLCRLRLGLMACKPQLREQASILRLLAIAIFVQSSPERDMMTSLFLRESEIVTDLVDVLRPDKDIPIEVRTGALQALNAMAHECNRYGNILHPLGASSHYGILPYAVRRVVAALTGASADVEFTNTRYIDALFSLILTHAYSPTEGANMSLSGVFVSLLPLIKDTQEAHIPHITHALRIVEAFLDLFQESSNTFHEMGAQADIIERIKAEVSEMTESCPFFKYDGVLTLEQENATVPLPRRMLLKTLLRCLNSSLHSQGIGRLRTILGTSLSASLCDILYCRGYCGAANVSLVMNIVSSLVHAEPTLLPTLQECGLTDAILDSFKHGLIPSQDIIRNLPNALTALCLNDEGLVQVEKRKPFSLILQVLYSPRYSGCVSNDIASQLGAGIDELLRHHATLKESGMQACVEV